LFGVKQQSLILTHFIITVCGGVIAGFNGQISSDNYPNSYPVNSNCSWLLMVPTGRTIRTQFNGTFNIAGSGTGCQGDYIQVCFGFLHASMMKNSSSS